MRTQIGIVMLAALLAGALAACAHNGTRTPNGTTQMFPDCTQVSADLQRPGRCMNR